MFNTKNFFLLSIFFILIGCSGDDDSFDAIEVTISSSNDEPDYDEIIAVANGIWKVLKNKPINI